MSRTLSRTWPRQAVASVLAVAMVVLLLALASAQTRDGGNGLVGGGRDRFAVSDRSFTISGTVKGQLTPGRHQILDLSIRNVTPYRLWITKLTVAVRGVAAPRATASRLCTRRDFAVRQPKLVHPVEVARGRTTDLSRLGVPRRRWPRITMLNTGANQDGCKGATLKITYAGAARRNRS